MSNGNDKEQKVNLNSSDQSKFQFEVQKPVSSVRIKVIGVGGCGCNIVDSMYNSGIRNVEFYVVNTDMQALNICKCPNKIQIGSEVTNGLGAGAVPEMGQKAAIAAKGALKEIIKDADMLFITAGLGGGTGTGASPVVAAIARELGILTVAFVTRPFNFEGMQRIRRAEQGVEKLREVCDTMIVVSNEKLLEVVGKKASLSEAFVVANNVLAQGVQSISDLITVPGLINVDFSDVKTIIGNAGKAVMGIGIGKGENRACEAIKKACASSLLDKIVINGATGVLVCFSGSDIFLEEIYQAMALIQNEVSDSANIILGVVVDPNYKDEIKVTIIATGAKNEPVQEEIKQPSVQNVKPVEHPTTFRSQLEKMLKEDEINPPIVQPKQETEKVLSTPINNEIKPDLISFSFLKNVDINEPTLSKDKILSPSAPIISPPPNVVNNEDKTSQSNESAIAKKAEQTTSKFNFEILKEKIEAIPLNAPNNDALTIKSDDGNGSDVKKAAENIVMKDNVDIIEEIPSFLRRRRRYFD